tara:strand:- start:12 stop:179 length:168 start_codon:yes stop_codon:yes gene_type:complete
MLRHPAAPAPKATNEIPMTEFIISVFVFDVNNPTAQVNITSDMTLGFMRRNNDLI